MRKSTSRTVKPHSPEQSIRQRFSRDSRRRRPKRFDLKSLFSIKRLQRWLRRAGMAAGLFFALIIGALLYLRAQSLPVIAISQTSQIYDAQGNLLDTFSVGQNRSSVALNAISPWLVEATLSIEDRRFYEHTGFDIKGMARATLVNVEHMSTKQGASTLTQQLARNLFLTHERTWQRKLKEAMYTIQLETNYTKDEILSLYLNQIYYGHGAYGIEAASQMYFGKPASALTLAESAMLAGIPKGPKYYSPYMDMKNAKDRQLTILQAMVEQNRITKAQADAAYHKVLAIKPMKSESIGDSAPYFRDYVRQIAVDELGIDEHLLNEGGIKMYTTLDPAAQKAADKAIADGIPSSSTQQVALVAIDPRTGFIKAMVGGRDYTTNQYNRTLAKTRQPGSSFKPVLYLTALEQGATPVTQYNSAPTIFTYDEGRQTYQPHNYNNNYKNRLISMREAIASSDNIYAVNTMMNVGPDNVITMSRKLGIESPMQPVPSLALGTFPVSPLEMASAFGTFANSGVRVKPVAILRIEDSKGEVLYQAHPQATQVVDAAHAYVLTNLMESVFETGGTGNRVSALIKRPVAGKTGTTAADAWLVGYTPELATAVWVGYDRGRELTKAEQHRAAPIFANFTETALASVAPKTFRVPDNVVSVYIDSASGKLAASGCAESRIEPFVKGTEPLEACSGSAGSPSTGARNGDASQSTEPQSKSSWISHLKHLWGK